MPQPFTLAACAEMLWRDKPIEWWAKRLTELGFCVGLWNWPDHDLAASGDRAPRSQIMNGYLEGRLAGDDGAEIGEIQVADNPGRCETGTGEINYAGIARPLADMGLSRAGGHGSLRGG